MTFFSRGNRMIYAINPVAKFAAAAILGLPLIFALDVVSASVALLLECILFFVAGMSGRIFFIHTIPVFIGACTAGLTTVLYGRASGVSYLQFFFANVTDGSLELGLAAVVRIMAVALPSVLLFVTIDPTDLADALAQLCHLPSRFVFGALAGLRLTGLFLDDWRTLERARRARGIGDTHRAVRLFGQGFTLLILSIRRGSTLATAMEARGFDSGKIRSYARVSRFGTREVVLMILALMVSAAAVATSLSLGTWRIIFT